MLLIRNKLTLYSISLFITVLIDIFIQPSPLTKVIFDFTNLLFSLSDSNTQSYIIQCSRIDPSNPDSIHCMGGPTLAESFHSVSPTSTFDVGLTSYHC